MPPAVRPSAVTMLYATAETAAAYRRMDRRGLEEWREQADPAGTQIRDLCERYLLSTRLPPPSPDWRDNPRAGLISAVTILATALGRDMPRPTRSTAT